MSGNHYINDIVVPGEAGNIFSLLTFQIKNFNIVFISFKDFTIKDQRESHLLPQT